VDLHRTNEAEVLIVDSPLNASAHHQVYGGGSNLETLLRVNVNFCLPNGV